MIALQKIKIIVVIVEIVFTKEICVLNVVLPYVHNVILNVGWNLPILRRLVGDVLSVKNM